MSISSEINRINGNISDSYDAVEEKGGTLPSVMNSANLADAILSIPSGGGVEWGFFAGNTLVCLDHLEFSGDTAIIQGSMHGDTFVLEG